MKKINNLVENILEGIEFLLQDKENKSLRGFSKLQSLKEKLKKFKKEKNYINLNHALQVYRSSSIFRTEAKTAFDTDVWNKNVEVSGKSTTLGYLLDELDNEYYKWKEGEMRVFR